MTVLSLQTGIIYGPIRSRRLGRSLGINLLPVDNKLCSFDCVYCHYGRTQHKTLTAEPQLFPGVSEVLDAVEGALTGELEFDYLTFSGNGEPTLHPEFVAIVAEVRRLLRLHRPREKLAILSNGTTVYMPGIRDALACFDVPVLKLDAGDRKTLNGINRPAREVEFERLLKSLKGVPALVIQSVLIDGRVSNIHGAPYENWLSALAAIQPTRVQVYSTDRPVPEVGVTRVPPAELKRIAEEIQGSLNLPARAYWA